MLLLGKMVWLSSPMSMASLITIISSPIDVTIGYEEKGSTIEQYCFKYTFYKSLIFNIYDNFDHLNIQVILNPKAKVRHQFLMSNLRLRELEVEILS